MTSVVLASFDRVPSAKGAARHIAQNHRILTAAGMDVSLVTLGDEPTPGIRHLPVHLAEPSLLRRALAFHARVRQIFEKNAFDVHHVRSPWEGLAVPVGRTIVYEVNGLLSVEAPYHHPAVHAQPALRAKLRRLELALADRASLMLTPSTITAQHLEELGVEPERIAVVPNAPVVPIAERVPEEHEGPVRLCYVGTLSPWQGVREALRALARVDLPFVLTIRTPSADKARRELVKLANKLGLGERVHIDGPLEPAELSSWLATQDVALAPLVPCERNLVQGGMPLKILDAMAAGLPVVAPDMPIVTAVLGPEHPTYRRHSTSDLVGLIAHLVSSRSARAAIGAQNLDRVRAVLSPEAQRDALLSAYRRVAS